MEEEISNFHISNIRHGLTPSMIFNFNNGVPKEEKREELRADIERRLSGSKNAGKFLLTFAQSKEKATEVKPVPLSQADKQYQFLSTESQQKILVSHRVTSPMLMGIKDNTGLGNNADELRTGYILYEGTVVKPFQELVTDAINTVTAIMNLNFDLYFKSLKPVEISEDAEQQQLEMSTHVCGKDMNDQDSTAWLEHLGDRAEYVDAELWEEHEELEVAESIEDELQAQKALERRMVKMYTEYADPQDKSTGDTGLYKIRYRYSPQKSSNGSRDFCIRMVADAREGAVYRLEDINEMSRDGVNSEFAAKGESNYSIWLYKGGVYCHHRWTRVVFFRKRDSKGRFLKPSTGSDMENDTKSSVTKARAAGVPRKVLRPPGFGVAGKRTIDLPNQGKKS